MHRLIFSTFYRTRSSVDIPNRNPLTTSRMGAALERVNVNLPSDARGRLKRLAKALKRTEGEVVRDLILSALNRAERSEFQRRVAASRTPERRARDREIAEALERLRG